MEHGPKSKKSDSAFLKYISTCVKSAKEIFFSIFIALTAKWVPRFTKRQNILGKENKKEYFNNFTFVVLISNLRRFLYYY